MSNSLQFDDPDPVPARLVTAPGARRPAGTGPSWLSQFTATLAGVVLGGAILVLGVRAYIRWSIQDTMDRIDERIQKDIGPRR